MQVFVAWRLLGIVFVVISTVGTAFAAEIERKDLGVLREQIRRLQTDLMRSEETHEEASDGLAAVDKGVSAAQRRLREISLQRHKAEEQVSAILAQKLVLENELHALHLRLGDALYRLYVEGGQGGARRFLSGDSPNQLGRDAYYLERIARQRIESIERARAAKAQLEVLLEEAELKRKELLALEDERRKEQSKLLAERRKQQDLLKQISLQLRGQRKQMQSLRRDESRIEKLLRGLEKIARSSSARKPKTSSNSSVLSETPETSSRRNAGVDSVDGLSGAFASHKGRFKWPVSGGVKARFGSPRLDGASTWKGVFIATRVGADVHSIAAGTIAFSDWLRGFGNLVIVDHGDGYMSVYGNNESIFKSPGDDVRAGEVIASAGSSGGLEESGLYFEIRYRGQPQDPAKWMAEK